MSKVSFKVKVIFIVIVLFVFVVKVEMWIYEIYNLKNLNFRFFVILENFKIVFKSFLLESWKRQKNPKW